MDNPVIIFGANYLGRMANEIFKTNGVEVYGFLDDDAKLHNKEIDEVMVLGSTDNDGFQKLIGKKCEAFVAIDDNRVRKTLTKQIQERRHMQPVNAIHEKVFLSPLSVIGHGNFIYAGVVLMPGTTMGSHCVLHTNVSIGVGASLGDYVQVGAGSTINTEVVVEEDVFIGSGVTIVSGVTIGKGARVGAGSVVVASVGAGDTVFGNPAQAIKK